MPCVRPLHQLTLLVAIPFLDLADKLVIDPCDLLQVIVGKLPPLPFQVAFELHPLSLELISIHRIVLLLDSNVNGPSGRILSDSTASGSASRVVRLLNI